jgi:hypothetical protein
MATQLNIEAMMKIWTSSLRKQTLMHQVIKDFWLLHQDYYLHQIKKIKFHEELDSIHLDIIDIIKACIIAR